MQEVEKLEANRNSENRQQIPIGKPRIEQKEVENGYKHRSKGKDDDLFPQERSIHQEKFRKFKDKGDGFLYSIQKEKNQVPLFGCNGKEKGEDIFLSFQKDKISDSLTEDLMFSLRKDDKFGDDSLMGDCDGLMLSFSASDSVAMMLSGSDGPMLSPCPISPASSVVSIASTSRSHDGVFLRPGAVTR